MDKRRLIDANLVILAAEAEFSEDDASKVRWLISHIPSVNAEPVRHGLWVQSVEEDKDWGAFYYRYTCTICGWSCGSNPYGLYVFCPGCGAKMDAEAEGC